MKKWTLNVLLTGLVALITTTPAFALDAEAVKQKLLQARPDLAIGTLKPASVPGFYEASVGGMTLYIDETGTFLFAGDMFLITPNAFVNATEQARTGHRRELLANLDESEMVVFSPAQELVKRTITVFTDIDCGYCRKLHKEVPELNRMGVAVRYLAYPRAGIGSASYDKLVSAWCAKNPRLALTRAKNGEEIEHLTCPNPIAAQYALGEEFGVNGTPAIVFEDGTLQPGYLPAAEMAVVLGLN